MPITQINAFVCDNCGYMESTLNIVDSYDDPIVVPPEGWDLDPDESGEEPFLCPVCLQKATAIYEAKKNVT